MTVPQKIALGKTIVNYPEMEQLIRWGKKFSQLGIAPGSTGNLSFRTKNGFVVTGTGIELGNTQKANLVEVLGVDIRKDGQIFIHFKGLVDPSKEALFHWTIYNLRPDVNAVFHLHDWAMLELGKTLEIPSTEQEEPPGTYELNLQVESVLRANCDVDYFILKDHGIVSAGSTIKEAGELAMLHHGIALERRG